LIRLGILFAGLPVGFVFSIIIGSVWGLVIAMLVAFVVVISLRRTSGSRG
jgi:hypothetical protein